jgi:hypothetical protein
LNVHANQHDLSGSHHSSSHHGAGDETNGHSGAWEFCPIGAAFGSAGLTAEFDFDVLVLAEPTPVTIYADSPTTVRSLPFWARAPPPIHSVAV